MRVLSLLIGWTPVATWLALKKEEGALSLEMRAALNVRRGHKGSVFGRKRCTLCQMPLEVSVDSGPLNLAGWRPLVILRNAEEAKARYKHIQERERRIWMQEAESTF